MREVKADATFPVERLQGVQFARVNGRPLLLDAVYATGRLRGEHGERRHFAKRRSDGHIASHRVT